MADFDDNRFHSKSTEWETPNELYHALDQEFHFTLDVAASPQNTKCNRFLSKETDALTQDWNGTCWMNPPYGRDVPKWLQKAIHESRRGVTTVCLIPARTNTAWFHELCFQQAEVRFIKGRPKFGDADHGLPFPLAVVIYRPRFQTVEVKDGKRKETLFD
jgi:phage N-6-adenine-methyltransferase